jgi:hypothetical protein
VKIVNALGDNFASEVLPGAAADPIARVDGWLPSAACVLR